MSEYFTVRTITRLEMIAELRAFDHRAYRTNLPGAPRARRGDGSWPGERCDCGVALDEHPPLPRPGPLRGWRSTKNLEARQQRPAGLPFWNARRPT